MGETAGASKYTQSVFISYRRADGQYAVGWIAERLRHLPHVEGVDIAFRDGDLEFGVDFPERLRVQVESCKVLIAVIGTNWRGVRDDGSARILDPGDWVGREIETALDCCERDPDKLIIPVLLAGVEPLLPSDLLAEHRAFADRHALRFDDELGIERLAMRVRLHLEQYAQRQAAKDRLDTEIELPSEHLPRPVWAAAALAGVVGAVVGWLFVGVGSTAETRGALTTFTTISTIQTAAWAVMFVLGVAYHHRVLRPLARIRWRSAAMAATVAVIVTAWGVVAFGVSAPDLPGGAFRTWLQTTLALALAWPWVTILVAPGWTAPAVHDLAGRAAVIGIERRGLRLALPAIVAMLVLSVVGTAELSGDGSEVGVIVLGGFLSLLVAGALAYSTNELVRGSRLVEAALPEEERYRVNAQRLLVLDGRSVLARLMWWAAVPMLAAAAAALVLQR